jgi:hypothetical protein
MTDEQLVAAYTSLLGADNGEKLFRGTEAQRRLAITSLLPK